VKRRRSSSSSSRRGWGSSLCPCQINCRETTNPSQQEPTKENIVDGCVRNIVTAAAAATAASCVF
jgi:hypothetical protein